MVKAIFDLFIPYIMLKAIMDSDIYYTLAKNHWIIEIPHLMDIIIVVIVP